MEHLYLALGMALVALTVLMISIGRSLPDIPRDSPRGHRVYFDPDPWGVGEVPFRGDPPVHRAYRASELFAADHLPGMDEIRALMRRLAYQVVAAKKRSPTRPRRPTSILLSGPPGQAMTVLAHQLARRFTAGLVQIDALYALPTSNGGSQHRIAPAVYHALSNLPSFILIRDLEQVSGTWVRDPARRRAAHDLLNETLGEVYGASHVVVAIYMSRDGDEAPRVVRQRFDHQIWVDVPRLECSLRSNPREIPDGWQDAA